MSCIIGNDFENGKNNLPGNNINFCENFEITSETLPVLLKCGELFPGGFFIYHADGEQNIIAHNRKMLSIFGCADEEEFKELTGNSFKGIVYNEDYELTEKSIREQTENSDEKINHVQYRYVRRDGSVGMMDDYGYFFNSTEFGKLFYVFVQDISEKYDRETVNRMVFDTIMDEEADRKTESDVKYEESLAYTELFLNTYLSAYYMDLETLSCHVYKRTAELERDYPVISNYFETLKEYIDRDVHPEDREMLFNVICPENLKNILKDKSEYTHIYRDISGGTEKTYRMQILRGADSQHVVFGFIDITEEARERNERMKLVAEANKLLDNVASQYSVAYTVNMANGEFKLLRMDRVISNKFKKFDSFEEAKESLFEILHSNDKNRMMNELSFDTIREKLKEKKSYFVEYRTAINNVTKWHEMNVTYVDADEVALGFAEKDLDITKRRLENMIFDEFLALFVVDLDTEMIKPVKTSTLFKTVDVENSVPYEEGMKLFASSYKGEAKEFFTRISDVSYLRKEFAEDDKRTFSYKASKLGEDTWIDVTTQVIYRHEDKTPAMITVGFSIGDAFSAARQKLFGRLTENLQIIGGLASGYDALYYVNIDEDIYRVYEHSEDKYPGSQKAYEDGTNIFEIIRTYGNSENIYPDDRYLFEDFNADSVREKLTGIKRYTVRFRARTAEGYLWNEMDVIKYENADEQANAVSIGFAEHDAQIRSEQTLNSSFEILSKDIQPDDAIDRLLAITGEYYGAERCYVFEYNKNLGIIVNTNEWCAEGIEPMKDLLQDIPMREVDGWNKEFMRQGVFYMDALDSEQNTEEGKAILAMQGIESLIAAPLMNGDEIVGFIGVDNPTKAKNNILIMKNEAAVIYSEILKRNESDEEHITLGKLTDAFISVYYTDLSTDYMRTWKIDKEYKEAYGNVSKYSESMGGYVRNNIAERDRERCIMMTSTEYVLKQFETKDQFSIDMTDIMLGYERSVVFDYIKVSEDGNQFVVCCRDVTESLTKEKEQQKMLQDALEQAKAANKFKTNFLFSMSHDIRTPMNAISGFTYMAIKHIDDRERVLDILSKIQNAGAMLLSLINSILEVSQIESGQAVLEEKKGDIYFSYANIESTMREMAETRDIDISFEFGNIIDRYVFVDMNRCTRIFVNVISNVIKFTKEGGAVKVRCEQIGKAKDRVGTYQYTISDNGIGMSEEFQQHVFDQFARENTATVSGIQGTGLGLSVCKSFVELMGGTITVQSTQGVGSTFTIVLPLKLQSGREYTDPISGEVMSAGGTPTPPKKRDFKEKRVLLVDDNEMNIEISIEILKEEDFIVEVADDGTTAVDMMKEKGADYYDYILMDIQMPIMDGYEATRIIREMYPDKHIPIIALSANAFAEDKETSLASGMDAHVAKPINISELFDALEKFKK